MNAAPPSDSDRFADENSAKADFDALYAAETPHAYMRAMLELDYRISERARPFFLAAVELLRARNGAAWPVQMLDVGCSYGVGAATLKYGCSFGELAEFFAGRAPRAYGPCVEATRKWLEATPPRQELRAVGLDTSAPALRFARDARLIQGALESDFEGDAEPTADEAAWLRGCNLVLSSGAIGYVTERSFHKLLPLLGRDHPGEVGPLGVFSILRMFDTQALEGCFADHGWRLTQLPGVYLPQRRFADAAERDGILSVLRERDLDPSGLEATGWLYAGVWAAAPDAHHAALVSALRSVAEART
ncbi:MAG: hypothetical protein R3F62_26375 [Planctomycetota bacterium]